MLNFEYQVISQSGDRIEGIIEAKNKKSAVSRLRDNGHYIVEIKEKKGKSLRFLNKVRSKDLSLFTKQFATLTKAGIPLVNSLRILEEQVNKSNLARAINKSREEVEAGKMLGASLGKFPSVFPKLLVKMISAGETGGILEEVLDYLADYYKDKAKLTKELRSVLIYPSLLLGIAILVLIFLFLFVLPVFVETFASYNLELPLLTRALILLVESINKYWPLILLVTVIVSFSTFFYLKSEEGSWKVHKLLLHLPMVGDLIFKVMAIRLTRTLGTLLAGGVSLLEALKNMEGLLGNKFLEAKVLRLQRGVKRGKSLSLILKDDEVFPRLIIQMVSVGEETGKLDEMLYKIAAYYQQELQYDIEFIISLLEPTIIVGMGGIIAIIMIATLLPMFNLTAYM